MVYAYRSCLIDPQALFTSFYLLYGTNHQLPTSLDFSIPVTRYPVVKSEYAKELAKKLKQVMALAQKNIQTKQREKKRSVTIVGIR